MGNFNRGRSGGRGFGDRNSRGPVQMHPAVCDKCRQNCEVPFRPTQGKPIFCNNCFDRNRGSDSKRFESRSEEFEQLNIKLDKILLMLSPTKKK